MMDDFAEVAVAIIVGAALLVGAAAIKGIRTSRRTDMAGKRTQAKTKGQRNRMGTMDFILLIVFLCLTVFTIAMIVLFTVYGSVPDTLITCVFATLGGECGILGWIKTTKEKKQERRWQLADMRREKEEAERIAQQTEEP